MWADGNIDKLIFYWIMIIQNLQNKKEIWINSAIIFMSQAKINLNWFYMLCILFNSKIVSKEFCFNFLNLQCNIWKAIIIIILIFIIFVVITWISLIWDDSDCSQIASFKLEIRRCCASYDIEWYKSRFRKEISLNTRDFQKLKNEKS